MNKQLPISKDQKKVGVIFTFFGIESRPVYIPIEQFRTRIRYAKFQPVTAVVDGNTPPRQEYADFEYKGNFVKGAYSGKYPLMELC